MDGKTDITINAEVTCSDGPGGTVAAIIVDPSANSITHIVVKDQLPPHLDERIVPVAMVADSSHDRVRLNCTIDELIHLPSFLSRHYEQKQHPEDAAYKAGEPDAPVQTVTRSYNQTLEEETPEGEVVEHQGTRVEAEDGHAGHVDEYMIDASSGQITHLVMRKGHLWGKKDVCVPVSAIASIEKDTIHLNLSKSEIKDLPSSPAK